MSESCANCKFSHYENNGVFCRRYPQTFQFLAPKPSGLSISGRPDPQQMQMVFGFPATTLDNWCGEWLEGAVT